MKDLFNTKIDNKKDSSKTPDRMSHPLADRLRPQHIEEIVGQIHILGEGKILRQAIQNDQVFSMIFWGPPGVGKTTLARIIAKETKSMFYSLSAVTAGVKDVRTILEKARVNLDHLGKRSILFIDEIHRFNKAQQDALLHEVEDGTIFLIGATTENPSFEVIAPLLSRCRVFQLNSLTPEEISIIIDRAIRQDKFLSGYTISFADSARELLIQLSAGDARIALNALELSVKILSKRTQKDLQISTEIIQEAFQNRSLFYDKKGDYHYDVISAFIKSIRGSDPDAALYWLARMIDAGEDPKFIARRMVILASEDIGNADPQALVVATSAFTAITYIGMPEGQLVLAQVATYLAGAPKSNASYMGIKAALDEVKHNELKPVPLHLRNAPTGLMAHFGYGEDYKYPHNFDQHFVEQSYLPEGLAEKIFYHPTEIGYEKQIKEYLLRFWRKRRENSGENE